MPAASRAGRLRVAHVVESLEMGGLEKLIVEFARHADRERFAPQVITLGPRGRLADEVEGLGCPVTALDLPGGLRPRAVGKLARVFRRDRVDVVHTHSEGPLLYATPAARIARAGRVVHTRHHGPDLGSSRRVLAAMALVSRMLDRVVCVADDGARHSIEEGIAASKVVTIRNGIDVDRFAFRGPAPRGPAVIVARLIPEKDHPTLLRALAIAARNEPEFSLDVAGDGPCRESLHALADSLGLGDRARFLGQVDDVPALLASSGQLVLASWLEGTSLTLLEAMARGLPVVATAVGGNPEVVVDGETGWLVPARTPEALAEAMLRLYRDPESSSRMGRAGRARVERDYDVRATVRRYEDLYLDRPLADGPRDAPSRPTLAGVES